MSCVFFFKSFFDVEELIQVVSLSHPYNLAIKCLDLAKYGLFLFIVVICCVCFLQATRSIHSN